MQLSVQDLAVALRTAPARIYRHLDRDGLPGGQVLDEIRFNRWQVLDWSLRRGIPLQDDLFVDVDEASPEETPLADAVARGGVRSIPGGPLDARMAAALAAELPELSSPLDDLVLGRVRDGSATGFMRSQAGPVMLPEVPRPLVCPLGAPLARIFYPRGGTVLEAGSGDERLMAWIWILSPTPLAHLQILERLGRLLAGPSFLDLLVAQAPAERVVVEARARERDLRAVEA